MSKPKETCKNCKFVKPLLERKRVNWQVGVTVDLPNEPVVRNDKGLCHRYPPDSNGMFPKTLLDDWCGEFIKKT